MHARRAKTVARQWWESRPFGTPQQVTNAKAIPTIFVLWIVAFALKHIGSAWDVAWHFRYVFEAFELPHRVNAVGTALALALLVLQSMVGVAVDQRGLRIAQIGMIIFLISIPLDIVNHWLFGLDVTIWSPTHMLQFAGTTVTLIGVLQSWLRLAEPSRWHTVIAIGFWAFLLDDALFMLSQQEYGVVALDAYARGQTRASPELLALAGRNPELFVRGGIPSWVYPVWLIVMGTLTLAIARAVHGWRWTATTAAVMYLAYRIIGYIILGAADFPQSFVPVMLLGGALVIDLAHYWRWQALRTTATLIGVYYGSAAVLDRLTPMPEFALITAPVVGLALWAVLSIGQCVRKRNESLLTDVLR